jgi:hypothetical protein
MKIQKRSTQRIDIVLQAIAAMALLFALTSCTTTSAPNPDDTEAMLRCVATESAIAASQQPDAAMAWAERAPELCAGMLDSMGQEEFNKTYLDEDVRKAYADLRMS